MELTDKQLDHLAELLQKYLSLSDIERQIFDVALQKRMQSINNKTQDNS